MDNKSFGKNLEKLREPIFKMAFWLSKDSNAARDVLQEVYLRMWLNRDKYKVYQDLKKIALKITRNLCVDLSRKNNRWLMVDVPEELSNDENPQQKLEFKDKKAIIQNMMKELPESQKTVLYLRGIEQLSTSEIASVMGLSENNVRVTLSRARKEIKVKIEKWYDD